MRGPFFEANVDGMRDRMFYDEDISDVEMMYTIIVHARARRRGDPFKRADEEVALVALCFMGFPGKTVAYLTEAKRMRQAFRRIARSGILQAKFTRSLQWNLLMAGGADDLRLTSIHDNFVWRKEEGGPGPGARPRPPTGVSPVGVPMHSRESAKARVVRSSRGTAHSVGREFA